MTKQLPHELLLGNLWENDTAVEASSPKKLLWLCYVSTTTKTTTEASQVKKALNFPSSSPIWTHTMNLSLLHDIPLLDKIFN